MDHNRPILALLFSLASLLPPATPATIFSFSDFTPNTQSINYSGDAFASGDHVIQLTRNQRDGDLIGSYGHAVYATPIQLRDPATRAAADFTTHFKFKIEVFNGSSSGDGLAFFLAPVGYDLPPHSGGGLLGLFNSTTNGSASTQLVAVEFDTFRNRWDPKDNHIGLDLNSIVSNATVTWVGDIENEDVGSAEIGYNSTGSYLYVYLSYGGANNQTPNLTYNLNLSEFLPERVVVGFSAATGNSTELHKIISWDFESSFRDGEEKQITPSPAPNEQVSQPQGKKKKTPWVVGVAVVLGFLMAGFGYLLVIYRRPWKKSGGEGDEEVLDSSMEDKLVRETSFPRKLTYKELVAATKNFREDGKLGQGGFGGVYLGVLNREKIAVKRLSRESIQGKKQYVSEVTAISRLRHRNLVRLIGWCHGYGEFLLVYEYMPNGSLDAYLFGKRGSLGWGVRYRIARGLAAALLYLHEEWEQCVVHRDVKSSNVMLDSGFNARLGDFGLARLVDHELGSQTTVLAGTMGYLAPECVATGRASKECDVFSFGVVALEIACGRKAVDLRAAREAEVRLVEWVWGMYGRGRVVEAADGRLGGEFEVGEMERLMVVGLWCAHPDYKARPTMRQAIQVLAFQGAMPSLPLAVPRATYSAPPATVDALLESSSSRVEVEMGTTTECAWSSSQCACSCTSSADSLLG